jgi:hypothetical protein
MKPFRASFTARAITAAASFGLIAGGLIALLGLQPHIALPLVLLITVGTSIVALVMGANDHPGAVAALAITMPMAFWAFTLGLLVVVEKFPAYGWVLIGLGAVPLVLLAGSMVSAPASGRDAATNAASAAARGAS